MTARCVTELGIQYHLCSTYRGLWGLVVVLLSWVSDRALAAQARGVLSSNPSTFLYFRLITSEFLQYHLHGCNLSPLATKYEEERVHPDHCLFSFSATRVYSHRMIKQPSCFCSDILCEYPIVLKYSTYIPLNLWL